MSIQDDIFNVENVMQKTDTADSWERVYTHFFLQEQKADAYGEQLEVLHKAIKIIIKLSED